MPLLPLLALVFGAAYLYGRHVAGVHVGAPVTSAHALPPPPRYVPRNEPLHAIAPSHFEPHRDDWRAREEEDRRRDRDRNRDRDRVYVDMAPACPPSPMAVMSELLAQGQSVPPFVIQCAIAEAELAGQYEVAYRLQQQYVIPALQGGPDPDPGSDPDPASVPSAPPPQVDDAMVDALADSGTGTGTGEPPPDAESPIQGVPRAAWCRMLAGLAREPAAFETPKHVGRYRQQKARLAEVGFDPAIIGGDARMQDLAMSHDLADCYRHLQASGTLEHYIGRDITLPGQPGAMKLTLSGLLGVCSVAGLERAIDWCENEGDRVKFPHTTMAGLRTNGAF